MASRFRLLPIVIFAAGLMLSVKIGDLWLAVSDDGAAGQAASLSVTTAKADDALAPKSEAPRPLMLAQAEPEPFPDLDAAPPDDAGTFETFDEDLPEGMTAAEVTDEEDPFADVAALSPGELRLLHELAGRRDGIQAKERELSEREAVLKAAEQQLVVTQRRLEAIREEIQSLVIQYDEEQEAEQARLRSIYSAMKAKSAAQIFNELDMDTLVAMMRGMSPRKLAPIIAAMNPQRARELTRELAEAEELPSVPN